MLGDSSKMCAPPVKEIVPPIPYTPIIAAYVRGVQNVLLCLITCLAATIGSDYC
jgi:hypothetical protein